MRRIVTSAFISLDGVMQAPGGPQEDPTGGFSHGGWLVPHMDETTGAVIGELFDAPFDLMLGRRTYDIFAAYWPDIANKPEADAGTLAIGAAFDRATKYVATHRPESLAWQNSRPLGPDIVAGIRALKAGDGPTLLTQGSSTLVHTLLAADLLDEIRLFIFPVVLGRGKRLFAENALPAGYRLTRSATSGSGVLMATYERAGAVPTGEFGPDRPTPAEIERRRTLT